MSSSEVSEILSELFADFKSQYANGRMTKAQQDELRRLHAESGAWGITLSQADSWMVQTGVIRKKVLSVHETGVMFARFKSFQISEPDFLKYLHIIAETKRIDIDEIKSQLITARVKIE